MKAGKKTKNKEQRIRVTTKVLRTHRITNAFLATQNLRGFELCV